MSEATVAERMTMYPEGPDGPEPLWLWLWLWLNEQGLPCDRPHGRTSSARPTTGVVSSWVR
ncbi:hypothetical protein OG604_01300 [Streptomyces sp. NBC_01231]|nr:hypothetical protein OG604_01300 [Streptomyces sp. NBC_01231]